MGVSVSVWVSGLLSICAYVSVSYACARVCMGGGGGGVQVTADVCGCEC